MLRDAGIDPTAAEQANQDGQPTPGWLSVQRALAARSARRN
jgi:hypothetical protein